MAHQRQQQPQPRTPEPKDECDLGGGRGGISFQGDRVTFRTHATKYMVEFSDPLGKKRPVTLKGRSELERFVRGIKESNRFRMKHDPNLYHNNDVPRESRIRTEPQGFLSLRVEVFESQFWIFLKWFRAVPGRNHLPTKFNIYFQKDEVEAVMDHIVLVFNLCEDEMEPIGREEVVVEVEQEHQHKRLEGPKEHQRHHHQLQQQEQLITRSRL